MTGKQQRLIRKMIAREWSVAIQFGDMEEFGIPERPQNIHEGYSKGLNLYHNGDDEPFIKCDNPMKNRP